MAMLDNGQTLRQTNIYIVNKASEPKDTHVSKRTSSNDVAGRVPTGAPT